ncbi:MAG: hypothetical protein R6U40_08065 [Desulfobacterales bacterium]
MVETKDTHKKQEVESPQESGKQSDFEINLDEIPNGKRKPYELCQFLEKMRSWRAESANSKLLIR